MGQPVWVASTLTKTIFSTLNRIVEPTLATGLGNPLPFGVGAVVVETTGRVSGKPRRVPVLTARAGNHLLISTVRPSSNWFANIEAEPTTKVQLGGRFRSAAATVRRGPLNTVWLELDDEEQRSD